MDKIGAYSAYQKTYADTVKSWKKEDVNKTSDANNKVKELDKSAQKEKVTLSNRAKELLKELQKKYGNMDFIVADYETEEEASALLARGTKEYSVLIEPDVLEQMASDEEVKAKYMGLIDESVGQLDSLKEKLKDSGEEVTRLGVSIGEDGTTKFFAQLEKMNEKQRERIQNAKEARKQERADAADKAEKQKETERVEELAENRDVAWTGMEKNKKVFLEAGSIEELLEKIQTINWDEVEGKALEATGNRIDFSI